MTIEIMIEKKLEGDLEKNIWVLSGDLTVFSLSEKAKSWIKLFPKSGFWVISGEKISKIDTAGLAFLLESVVHAKNNNIKLRFSVD